MRGQVLPIGAERMVRKKNAVYIKTAMPNVWKQKKRVVWENAHGEIPAGKVLLHLDGNAQNCNIDNLRLVTKREWLLLARLGRRSNLPLLGPNPDVTSTGIAFAQLLDRLAQSGHSIETQFTNKNGTAASYRANWRKKNADHVKQYSKKYGEKNREALRQKSREYYSKNRTKVLARIAAKRREIV